MPSFFFIAEAEENFPIQVNYPLFPFRILTKLYLLPSKHSYILVPRLYYKFGIGAPPWYYVTR